MNTLFTRPWYNSSPPVDSQQNKSTIAISYPPNPDNHPCYDESIGWYTAGGSEIDFASYLHNPWGYPSKVEEAAMKIFTENIHPIDYKLITLLNNYFQNRQQNEKEGLTKQYNNLKKHVIDNNFIGLIYYGADVNRINYNISKYTTQKKEEITLTVNSICQTLITDYIKEENVEQLCRNCPDFHKYYTSE
jgi:hypothetical protein